MPFSATLTSLATRALSTLIAQDAVLIVEGQSEPVKVQFNPAEYNLMDGANYSQEARPQCDSPILNFAGGKVPVLKMSLYFNKHQPSGMIPDVTALFSDKNTDVSKDVEKIAKLVRIDGDLHRPPVVCFIWGSLNFIGYIRSVSSQYTIFAKSGKPLRAKVDVEFIGVAGEEGKKLSPFQSPDRTKCRVLTQDDNIWSIALREYGDIGKWRLIADANGIMNPMDIPVGTVLKVPAL